MSTLSLKIIQCNNEFIDMAEFMRLLPDMRCSYAYVPDKELDTSLFSEYCRIIFDDELSVPLKEKYFNPLVHPQNILLLDESFSVLAEVPVKAVECHALNGLYDEYYSRLATDEQRVMYENLLCFGMCKQLRFLNEIIFRNIAVPYRAFNFLKQITEPQTARAGLKEFTEILCAPAPVREQAESRAKTNPRKKNIVVIHLESLSNEIFYNNLEKFPHLGKLMSQSMQLNRFYSSASSSAMSLFDFFFGNDFETDRFPQFDEMYREAALGYGKNLFEILHDNGYKTLGLGYKVLHTEEVNKFNMWDFAGERYEWESSLSAMWERTENFIEQNKERPFAMHLWNLLTHSGHKNDETDKGDTYVERMDISYALLDETVNRVVSCLQENNLLEDTIILGYGDHGDDKWTRSMNFGFCHIIEPYMNVIATPAFIYDTDIPPELYNGIVSMVDLKPTLLKMVGIDSNESFPYMGIDIFTRENEEVYSRSLLTNQQEIGTISSPQMIKLNHFSAFEHKNKAYSVINRKYSLMAGKHGLELYLHANDPGNYNNLLNFFELRDGKLQRFFNHGAWRGHFRSIMMMDAQIYDMMKNFYELRAKLRARIELKESMVQCDEKNNFDMRHFDVVRKRGFI